MKSIGIVRKIDHIGRIVVPREVLREKKIEPLQEIEIYVDGDRIIIKRHHIKCDCCDDVRELTKIGNISLCHECRYKIANTISK